MAVWEIVLGFMDSQAVLAGEPLGVFNRLSGRPVTVREVAERYLPESLAEYRSQRPRTEPERSAARGGRSAGRS